VEEHYHPPLEEYLETIHRFVPGTTALISSRAGDGTLMLEVGESTVAFGSDLLRRLFVAAV
jgi:hypothetical protein